jgi:hypothetical protein
MACCCPFESALLWRLCNGSSFSATTESTVGADFCLVIGISFPETRNHKRTDQASKETGGPQPCLMVKNSCSFCSSVSNQGTNFSDICRMLKSSLRICWHLACKRLSASDFQNGISAILIDNFVNFLHISVCKTCGGTISMITILTDICVHLDRGNHSNLCSPHSTVSKVHFEHFIHF